jgi:hypothetical protein
MYTGIACFVLFDARGTSLPDQIYVIAAVAVAFVLVLGLKYIPSVFHRPHLVDALCVDILAVSAHALGVVLISDPVLRHACALHSACYVLQHRFNGLAMACLLLLGAYCYGPRVTDVSHFVIGVAYPHVLELGARVLETCHTIVVMSLMHM